MEMTQHVYTPGARYDEFRNDFQNIFLSRLRLPSIVFVIVKNKFTSFFHGMYFYLPEIHQNQTLVTLSKSNRKYLSKLRFFLTSFSLV